MRHLVLLLTAAGAIVSAPSAHADDWQPHRVQIAGADKRVWVIAESKPAGDKLPVVRVWSTDADTPKPSPYLRPISGDPIAAAATDKALRILYEDLSLWRYEPKSTPSTGALFVTQSDQAPLAFAGDAAGNTTWFLVDADSLVEPESATQPAIEEPSTTQPAATQPAASQPATPPEKLALLRLERGFWTRIDVPKFAAGFTRYRLSVRDKIVHVFWIANHNTEIDYATYSEDEWTPQKVAVSGTQIERCWAGSSRDGPVLILGTPTADPKKIELSIAFQTETGWQHSKPAGPGSTTLKVDPDKVAATIAKEQLAVAFIDGDDVRFAWGDISASPTIRASTLTKVVPSLDSSQQRWQDFVETAILLLMFTIVLATRREQMQTPAAVPEGYVLAPNWRRGFAALIDFSPAAIVVLLLYGDTLIPLMRATNASSETLAQTPAQLAQLQKIWFVFVAIYGAWCFILEALGHTTLGKRILNCRVLSADGSAPTGRQIVIRNILRIIIVGFGMSGLLVTFMLMAMFTINRQRLGDILANTIVVQPAPKPLDPHDSYPYDDHDSTGNGF